MSEEPVLLVDGLATRALWKTLDRDRSELDPGIVEDRARAIAAPVVWIELNRQSSALADQAADLFEQLARERTSLDPAAYAARLDVLEVLKAAALRLGERAEEVKALVEDLPGA